MTSARIDEIQTRLIPLRTALLAHPVYQGLDSLDALHRFMQHHVFAVWDFMSLLKALQRKLCCVDVPWLPPAEHTGCRLVNEIVLGEESDADGQGGWCSHFDLYHRAMNRCGAGTQMIDGFLSALREGGSVSDALESAGAPVSVRRFVARTFDLIDAGNICAVAAAFTFGREDLLPDVFQQIVNRLNAESAGVLRDFQFYLSRHIELDSGEHGPMAAQLVSSLCGDDEARWQSASDAAVSSLELRLVLWDGML